MPGIGYKPWKGPIDCPSLLKEAVIASSQTGFDNSAACFRVDLIHIF